MGPLIAAGRNNNGMGSSSDGGMVLLQHIGSGLLEERRQRLHGDVRALETDLAVSIVRHGLCCLWQR